MTTRTTAADTAAVAADMRRRAAGTGVQFSMVQQTCQIGMAIKTCTAPRRFRRAVATTRESVATTRPEALAGSPVLLQLLHALVLRALLVLHVLVLSVCSGAPAAGHGVAAPVAAAACAGAARSSGAPGWGGPDSAPGRGRGGDHSARAFDCGRNTRNMSRPAIPLAVGWSNRSERRLGRRLPRGLRERARGGAWARDWGPMVPQSLSG